MRYKCTSTMSCNYLLFVRMTSGLSHKKTKAQVEYSLALFNLFIVVVENTETKNKNRDAENLEGK